MLRSLNRECDRVVMRRRYYIEKYTDLEESESKRDEYLEIATNVDLSPCYTLEEKNEMIDES